MRLSALAAKPKSQSRSGTSKLPAKPSRIEQARRSGVDVAADTYAYTAGFNSFSAIIPPWAHDGGDKKLIERLKDPTLRARIRKEMETPSSDWNNEWQQVTGPESFIVGAVQNPKLLPLQGKTIAEIARIWNKDPIDTVFDLLIEDEAFTQVALFIMSEPDVVLGLQQPWVSVCNDSQGASPDGILGKEHPHPRAYGAFPHILHKYVHDEKKLTLEDAIRKFTALPAQRMRFAGRGVLKAGMWADVVVFDPDTIHDLATFDAPNQLSEGMRFVLVNGVPVIEEGKMTNALPGKVLDRH
ncbi:Dihydroorotase (fragment) [Candidatus Sulfopaludibacter sp. SbA3]